MRRLLYIFAALCVLHPGMASEHEDTTVKAYRLNIPKLSDAPKIDGKLEEPVWGEAVVLEDFTQYEPVEGSVPTEKTIAYIGYDSNNLYLAVRCYDSQPNAVRACLTQRDKSQGDDEVTVYLDTFNDKKRAFAFVVNPCGVQTDGIFTEQRQMGSGHRGGGGGGGGGGGFDRIDKNWDTFFTTDAFIDETGFTVELAIPFKSLRFPHSDSQTWGLQIKRKIPRKNEEIYWSPRSRDIDGFLIQSGTMTIEGDLATGKNMEIMPVITGLKERQGSFKPEPSINFKYGITSDLTADMTLNPDFSQVEADMPQIDVNQRYALYYREKRPFFLEGKDLFDTPLELVYTRKIINPLWGTKLTGKIGKTSLAFLSAFDESPPEIDIGFEDTDDDEDEEDLDFGRSWVNVFRMKHDLFSESNIGFILTDKEMGAPGQSLSQDFNRVAGVDGYFKFKKNYQFSFQVLGSQSRVTQRETNITEKTDVVPAAFFNFRRNSRHWNLSADYTQMPEDFEAATGYFQRKDIRSLGTRMGYNILPQNKYIVDIRPSIEYRRIYDFNNILTDEQFQIGGFMSGWSGTFLFASYSHELERYEDIDFRKNSARLSLNSEPFSWFSGNISYSFGDGIYYDGDPPFLGYLTSMGMRLTFKPSTTLRFFYNIRQDNFTRGKGGERVYRINIISQRINIQISRPLSLRVITDYNDYYKDFYSSILLSYQLNPGTVFYIGMDDSQSVNDSGVYNIDGRYFFVKFSYWWRV